MHHQALEVLRNRQTQKRHVLSFAVTRAKGSADAVAILQQSFNGSVIAYLQAFSHE
jgi:hypothetical protein